MDNREITTENLSELYGDALYCVRLGFDSSLDADRYDDLMSDLFDKVESICTCKGFDFIEVRALAIQRLNDDLACTTEPDFLADTKLLSMRVEGERKSIRNAAASKTEASHQLEDSRGEGTCKSSTLTR